MKNYIPLKTRFWVIQAACLILFLLAAQGCAIRNEFSVSRVDSSMGQRVQAALERFARDRRVRARQGRRDPPWPEV